MRREKVMDAACRLFLAEGFAETTLEAIGREAGVTKRAIYELCGDKSDLFRAACDSLRVQGPHFSFEVAVAGRRVRDVLLDMARQLVEHSFGARRLTISRFVMAEVARFPDLVARAITEGRDSLQRGIGSVFEELARQADATAVPAREAALLFYDAVVGVAGLRAALGCDDERPSDRELALRVDMFLHGYLQAHVAAGSGARKSQETAAGD